MYEVAFARGRRARVLLGRQYHGGHRFRGVPPLLQLADGGDPGCHGRRFVGAGRRVEFVRLLGWSTDAFAFTVVQKKINKTQTSLTTTKKVTMNNVFKLL